MEYPWADSSKLDSRKYVCGHCDNPISSEDGYVAKDSRGNIVRYIYICHYCELPTFFNYNDDKIPGSSFGKSVGFLPEVVESLYDEARNCTQVSAYTASVLCSRKLLMNIAVSKGAKEGLKFVQYIDYLADKNYLPPGGREWVDHIRKTGNEATHEIKVKGQDDAEELIKFMEMLLKFIYEFPGSMKKKGG
jgi:hypothetical protein